MLFFMYIAIIFKVQMLKRLLLELYNGYGLNNHKRWNGFSGNQRRRFITTNSKCESFYFLSYW